MKCRSRAKSTKERCRNDAEPGKVTCRDHVIDEERERFRQDMEDGKYMAAPTLSLREQMWEVMYAIRVIKHATKTRTAGKVREALLQKVEKAEILQQNMIETHIAERSEA